MRNLIFILLFFPFLLQAQTAYYVSTTGSNSNSGTAPDEAWASLSYACSNVHFAGSVIYVLNGTYNESSRCVLDARVSIQGISQGSTIINFSYAASSFSDGCIYAVSSSVVNGQQSISNLTITTTNYASARGIYTRYRSNFSIHHVTIRGFDKSGINAYSEIDWVTPPATYTTGLKIYNCTIEDNTESPDNAGECNLRFSGHEGYEIYNNVFRTTARLTQRSVYSSQVKNGSFHDNTIYTRETISGTWLFAMELWNNRGGVEIYNNIYIGGGTIDIGGHTTQKGIYDYGVSIHDNTMTLSSLVAYNSIPTAAMTIECWVSIESVYVYRNRIKNFPWGINITAGQPGATIEDLYIYSNIIEGVSNTDVSWNAFGIGVIEQETVDYRRNINIINNTITGNHSNAYRGVYIAVDGTNDDFKVKNNIIQGFTYGVRVDNYSGTIDSLHLVNNLINDCNTTVSFQSGTTYTNHVNSGQLTSDPLFVSSTDFHLQATSPAIGAGVYVGSPYLLDYDEIPFLNPPSRGAYERATTGQSLPIVSTSPVLEITQTTAVSGGNISSDGGQSISARGVCWSIAPNPTPAGDKTEDGTGTGTFTSTVTGLTNGQTYYLRAYATNSIGTAYGLERVFTTPISTATGAFFVEYNGVLVIHNGRFVRASDWAGLPLLMEDGYYLLTEDGYIIIL